MGFFGKVLLFIGGIGFLVCSVGSGITLGTPFVSAPAPYFGSSAGLWLFVFDLLWFLLNLLGGFAGLLYVLGYFLCRKRCPWRGFA